MPRYNIFSILISLLVFSGDTCAADWPMYRFDAQRGNATPHPLPKKLHFNWKRTFAVQPAWPETQSKLQYDAVPQPIVLGKQIFIPSTVTNSLTAFATRDGKEQWRFYAEAPIRFAPVGYKDKVLFVSDDGYLYCLRNRDGKLLWKVGGGPNPRWIIGNHRLISSWPARGGPVLHEGKVFFAAGIWPFMGIFIRAVNPDTGEVVWTNSGEGTNFTVHPHGAPSFGSICPQGHLVATGNHLVVPGGMSPPAVFATNTGIWRHFRFDGRVGGHDVRADEEAYFVGGYAYHAETGTRMGLGVPRCVDEKQAYYFDGKTLIADSGKIKTGTKIDRRGKKISSPRFERKISFRLKLNGIAGPVVLKAGDLFITGGRNKVAAFSLPAGKKDIDEVKALWSVDVEGNVHHMIAADDRLFVMTEDANLYCFGPEKSTFEINPNVSLREKRSPSWRNEVASILQTTQKNKGYAVIYGLAAKELIWELTEQSNLYLLVVEPDAEKGDQFRRLVGKTGLYGKRISVFVGDPVATPLPPYLAKLILVTKPVIESPALKRIVRTLRPYGGQAVLKLTSPQHNAVTKILSDLKEPQIKILRQGNLTRLVREGALPYADDWTHQYGNPGQTGISLDKNVKAPLGLLWFGGPSHEGILPRHGHGPSPQVAGGRLFIEGPDMLRAVDVYSGIVLWEKELKDFGRYYNTTRHFPGAGEVGSNYVSLADKVYAVYGNVILELHAATGKLNREFKLHPEEGKEPPYWGSISVWKNLLVATSSPVSLTGISSDSGAVARIPDKMVALISPHAKWHYLAGTDPKDGWQDSDFNYGKWKTGTAGFGYGDGDDRTPIAMRGKFGRVYIRTSFMIKHPEEVEALQLHINYDDAFIAYLNGKEICRRGVRRGNGAKASGIRSHEAGRFESFPIGNFRKYLKPGKNFLAVEGHNVSLRSSDFTLDPFLVAKINGQQVKEKEKRPHSPTLPMVRYSSGSRKLVVFDRHSGKLLWSREAEFNFRHNNIAVGGGKVFCIDSMTSARKNALERRGIKFSGKPTLYALNATTGKVIWSTQENIFGTFLSYSKEQDLVLQAGSSYRDRAADEVNTGMIAYRGKDGEVLWHNPTIRYGGPCLLWKDKILTNGSGGFAIDIKSGKPTGWKYKRMYGCNTALGSEHLLTFRSGCAGFFDLENDSGTGNLGGFRSSCTNNLIVANGVLNAPDYTRTCSCAYQNQTSLALIHMPEAEFWTFGGVPNSNRAGYNFGAPGDRRDKNGTLWKADSNAELDPEKCLVHRMHSSLVETGDLRWVAASAIFGVRKIRIPVEKKGKYQIKLIFLEPKSVKPGERVFSVLLQGNLVVKKLDVVNAAGGTKRTLKKQFSVILQNGFIDVELQRLGEMPTIISGVEIVSPK